MLTMCYSGAAKGVWVHVRHYRWNILSVHAVSLPRCASTQSHFVWAGISCCQPNCLDPVSLKHDGRDGTDGT